jgi:hypothetical protein
MLKIFGMSNAENLLMGVNRLGHCLTSLSKNHFANRFSCSESELSKDLGFQQETDNMHVPVARIGKYCAYPFGIMQAYFFTDSLLYCCHRITSSEVDDLFNVVDKAI